MQKTKNYMYSVTDGKFQELLGALQNHILDFTQRLHSVEVERRNLVIEVNKLKEECGDMPQKEEVIRLQEELNHVKNKVRGRGFSVVIWLRRRKSCNK